MAQTKEKPAKQVHLADELRRQTRLKKRKRRIIILCVIALVIAYFAGVFSAMLSAGEALYESATIALATQAGFPVQTGISALYQVEELSGGFVALGQESCMVYSSGGNRLRSIQSGYLRPAIAVGSNRYLLYNRAGYTLRVESRTQTLYTKTFSNSILLAAISDKGTVAVVTESDRYLASLTMYSSSMQETLSYSMTDSEGTPIRMEYAPDSSTLAVATIAAQNGQMLSQVYLISVKNGSVPLDAQLGETPLAMEWVSDTALLVLYDSKVVLYNTETQTQLASYDYQNQAITDYSYSGGTLALLLTQGTHSSLVVLDSSLAASAQVALDTLANQVVLDDANVYVVAEKEIATYTQAGEYISTYQSEQKILSLLQADELLLFTANETSVFTPPSGN